MQIWNLFLSQMDVNKARRQKNGLSIERWKKQHFYCWEKRIMSGALFKSEFAYHRSRP